ncbi:MAG: hypothetical protein NTY12_03480 [Candidatus Falkowbacteria bacterium]|nr:hypothetical protein [Candidatus Falkowbacteria bacterium]
MNFQEFFKSKTFQVILYVTGALAILLFVFQAGLFIGFRKASFSFGWGENYHRNFGGPRQGFLPGVRGDDFINGHGVAGMIIKIDNKSIVMKDVAGIERIVNTNEQTDIKNGRDNVILKDLKADERIVVLGIPEQDGSVTARMIRIFNGNDFNQLPPPMPGDSNLPLPPTGMPKINQPFTNQIK